MRLFGRPYKGGFIKEERGKYINLGHVLLAEHFDKVICRKKTSSHDKATLFYIYCRDSQPDILLLGLKYLTYCTMWCVSWLCVMTGCSGWYKGRVCNSGCRIPIHVRNVTTLSKTRQTKQMCLCSIQLLTPYVIFKQWVCITTWKEYLGSK